MLDVALILMGSHITSFLIEHGAKVNVVNKRGWTPLIIAEGLYFSNYNTTNKATELSDFSVSPPGGVKGKDLYPPRGISRAPRIPGAQARRA